MYVTCCITAITILRVSWYNVSSFQSALRRCRTLATLLWNLKNKFCMSAIPKFWLTRVSPVGKKCRVEKKKTICSSWKCLDYPPSNTISRISTNHISKTSDSSADNILARFRQNPISVGHCKTVSNQLLGLRQTRIFEIRR